MAGIGQRPTAIASTNPSDYGIGDRESSAGARRHGHGERELSGGNGGHSDGALAIGLYLA